MGRPAICAHCGQPLPPSTRPDIRHMFAREYRRTSQRPGFQPNVEVLPFTDHHAADASSALQDHGLPLHAANYLIGKWNVEGRRVSAYNGVTYRYELILQ